MLNKKINVIVCILCLSLFLNMMIFNSIHFLINDILSSFCFIFFLLFKIDFLPCNISWLWVLLPLLLWTFLPSESAPFCPSLEHLVIYYVHINYIQSFICWWTMKLAAYFSYWGMLQYTVWMILLLFLPWISLNIHTRMIQPDCTLVWLLIPGEIPS